MIAVRLVQPENAPSPMLVTLLGIVTLVRLVQQENAPSPMLHQPDQRHDPRQRHQHRGLARSRTASAWWQ